MEQLRQCLETSLYGLQIIFDSGEVQHSELDNRTPYLEGIVWCESDLQLMLYGASSESPSNTSRLWRVFFCTYTVQSIVATIPPLPRSSSPLIRP